MAKVELKQPIVQEISENVKDAQSVVVVQGLQEYDDELRIQGNRFREPCTGT